jgi:hypothetical protein
MCVSGQPEFKIEHAVWLHEGARGKTLSILDISRSEDIFVREEVSLDQSMLVEGIQLNVQGRDKYLPQTTKSQHGLYQINTEMLQWAEGLTAKLQEAPRRPINRQDVLTLYSENREWVNDDTLLIKLAVDATLQSDRNAEIALFSGDKRLANQMAQVAHCRVILCDPLSLAECYDREWSSTTTITTMEVYQAYSQFDKTAKGLKEPTIALIDVGSLFSHLSNKEIHENKTGQKEIYSYSPVKSYSKNGIRTEVTEVTKRHLENYIRIKRVYDPFFLERKSRRKSSTYSSSSSSSRYTWDSRPFSSRVTSRQPKFIGR